jgi:hypothetical protein
VVVDAVLAADILVVDSGVNGIMMMKKLIALTALVLFPAVQAFAEEVPRADISTEAMVNLCQDKTDMIGQTFCFGFGEGVYQGSLVSRDPKTAPTVCVPEGGLKDTREQVLAEFLIWARANPQYNKEYAASTVLRYLPIRFPCKG